MKALLAIVSIIQKADGKRLFVRTLLHLVIITGLLLVTVMMIAATLIGGLMHTHIYLLDNGMSGPGALLVIGASALALIALLIVIIVWRIRCLRHLRPMPMDVCAAGVVNAFIAGLMKD